LQISVDAVGLVQPEQIPRSLAPPLLLDERGRIIVRRPVIHVDGSVDIR